MLLLIVFLFQASAFAVDPTGFSDVSKDAWYAQAVAQAAERNLVNGVGDNCFAPNATMTRAMVAAILWRYEGEEKIIDKKPKDYDFCDLSDEAWYYDPALWTIDRGMINVYKIYFTDPTGSPFTYFYIFEGNAAITREEMATVLSRYVDYKEIDTSQQAALDTFLDADLVSDWAVENVAWCVAAGIMEGSETAEGERYLNPQDEITRAEASAMMIRLFEKVIEATPEADNPENA